MNLKKVWKKPNNLVNSRDKVVGKNNSESEMHSVQVMITGRVQGVGFRNWCVHEAHRLSLSGWVRNRQTGEVEAVFCGLVEDVNQMLERCWDGPGYARVENVTILGKAGLVSGAFEEIGTV